MDTCPFIQQLQEKQKQGNDCIISEAYKILEIVLAVLEPEMAPRDEKLVLNTEEFLGLETVRGRTYRLVIETHQKDSSGHVVLSENLNDQIADLLMKGGKCRFKLGFVYYDSCEEEVDESQCHPLFCLEATVHDTKAAANFLQLGMQFMENSRTNSLLPGDSTPVRCVINKHIKYTTDEEEQSNSHYTVFKNRFCHWKSFKVTTAASLDDTHNFIYGGPCNVDTILYHKQTKQNKCIVPDSWITAPTFQLAQIFLKDTQ